MEYAKKYDTPKSISFSISMHSEVDGNSSPGKFENL